MLHNTGQYVSNEVSVGGQTNSTSAPTQSESNAYNHFGGQEQQPQHSSFRDFYDLNMAGVNQCSIVPKIDYSPNFMSSTLLQNCSTRASSQPYNLNKKDGLYGHDNGMKTLLNIPNVSLKKSLLNNQYYSTSKLDTPSSTAEINNPNRFDQQAESYVDHLLTKSFDSAKYSVNNLAISDTYNLPGISSEPTISKKNEITVKPENVLNGYNIESQISKHSNHSNVTECVQSQDPNTVYYNEPKTNESSFNLGIKTYKDPDSRKRSLEKTVQMIETIILNSSTRAKNVKDTKDSISSSKKQKIDNLNEDSGSESSEEDDVNVIEQYSVKQETLTDSQPNNTIVESQPDKKIQLNNGESINLSEVRIKQEVKIEPMEIEVDIAPHATEPIVNPFQNDAFGVRSEDVLNKDIYDADYALRIAQELIKTGALTDSYFECPYCNLYFNNPKRFLIHIKWHSFGLTNAKRFELQKEKEMKKIIKREAKELERIKEIEENKNGVTHRCTVCEKIFTSKVSLRNHRQREHSSQSRDCKICGKGIVGWRAMRSHLATHTNNDGRYMCTECPKKFKHPHSLTKHRDTHREKTHPCPQCSKLFGSELLMNIHMKCHERTQRGITHHCTYCGKGFFESFSLQAHERTHRNERPFECEICNTRFGTNSSLKRHLKVSHNTSKPFECSVCHRCFISEAIRDRHEERAHSSPDDFKFRCTECPGKYLRMKDLRKHIYKVHPKGRRKRITSGGESDD
ncbi:zinc finger protein 510-like [Leptidea sinapis]|uniref:zinc finger protein 510-like n=1 Tax=Leptidea sinapis TaxID=189913 RepID=UPI0021222D56|nr:zinc finger protein 510-like [Leptidea sinapis]